MGDVGGDLRLSHESPIVHVGPEHQECPFRINAFVCLEADQAIGKGNVRRLPSVDGWSTK
jgi:hypothetical protein